MDKQDLNPQDVMRDFVEDLKTLSLSDAEEIDKLREENAKLLKEIQTLTQTLHEAHSRAANLTAHAYSPDDLKGGVLELWAYLNNEIGGVD